MAEQRFAHFGEPLGLCEIAAFAGPQSHQECVRKALPGIRPQQLDPQKIERSGREGG
jgi:hypothetical protein